MDASAAEAEDVSVMELMANASATRITAITRTLYDSHLRQMAVWCLSTERFRQCVGADGKMLHPLDSDAMIMFTEHLLHKMVPWPFADVPGTMKHLAVKTVSNFFAAAGFTFAMRNEKLPQPVAQYFSNTKKSYTLTIAKLKDAGLHPDSTNSTGVNFSVYERICIKLGGYAADFKGSCYSSWRDLWLFWVFLFNLLGRCSQVSKICFEMIWWQDDALVVKVPSQKGDRHPSHTTLNKPNDHTTYTPPHSHTPSCIVIHHTPPSTAHTPPHRHPPSYTAIHHTPPAIARHYTTSPPYTIITPSCI